MPVNLALVGEVFNFVDGGLARIEIGDNRLPSSGRRAVPSWFRSSLLSFLPTHRC
jgi:hypothetical protein